MNLSELKTRPAAELVTLGEELGLENLARSRKQDIIFSILKAHAQKGENIYGEGVLEILQDGFGVGKIWEVFGEQQTLRRLIVLHRRHLKEVPQQGEGALV